MGADVFVGDAGCAQFVAQSADVGVDGVRVGGVIAAEHGGEQFFAAEHAAGAVQQGAQQAGASSCQMGAASVAGCVCVRRSTAFTRATSSRGLKGLPM